MTQPDRLSNPYSPPINAETARRIATATVAEARKNGMLYVREEGLRLVVRGVTSADELMRVVK